MDRAELVTRLRGIPVMRPLSDGALAGLAPLLAIHRTPEGGVLFEEGSEGDALFLLVEGAVRIEKRVEAGGAKELARLGPGEVFGEMALLERAPRSARAVAVGPVTCLSLDRAGFDGWVRADPPAAAGFLQEMARLLSHRVRRISEHVVLLHDLGDLAVRRLPTEADLLQAALVRLLAHLGEEWSGAADLSSEFADGVDRVASLGDATDGLPAPHVPSELVGWPDGATVAVALPGRSGHSLGALVLHTDTLPDGAMRRELEVVLVAAGRLLGAALEHLRRDTEERLRARLERERLSWPPA